MHAPGPARHHEIQLILRVNDRANVKHLAGRDAETRRSLLAVFRGLVGLEPGAVEQAFSAFVQKHPRLSSQQLRFLQRLQNHIANNGGIEIERLYEPPFTTLHAASGKTGQGLRENEWLMAIKQRASIPGGTSEFDLPSYHAWLHHGAARRRDDLSAWLKTLLPVHAALAIVLRVLRESGRSASLIAFQGMYQQTPAEKPAQMLRLSLAQELPCVPEISANKYALNVRFLLPDGVQRTRVYEHDVPFELAFCNL